MRRKKESVSSEYSILILDDEQGIIDSLMVVFKRSGYQLTGMTDPLEAIERMRKEHFDLLILDYLMMPIHGDKVVEEIRKFNKELYILLLTGHKDIAPPLETIKTLDIQGYCEKSDRFDQLQLLVESAIKCVSQMNTIVKAHDQLKSRYLDTIEALRLVVDAKDEYTKGHSDRVSEFAVKIGQALKLSKKELEILKIGGYFHDIGKIGTADDILFKTEALCQNEFDEIKKHPVRGANILSAISMFHSVVPLVRCHHERIDGKGYPEGLMKEDIPFLARILSVSDAFDAMISDRHYRSKLDITEAVQQLKEGAGTQFDESIVAVFFELMKDFDAKERKFRTVEPLEQDGFEIEEL